MISFANVEKVVNDPRKPTRRVSLSRLLLGCFEVM